MNTLAQVNPSLARLLNQPWEPTVTKRRERAQSPLSPEEQEGFVQQAMDAGRSTLSAVGNVLDLPGSVVRDALAWRNPLDQFLTPTSGANRTSGRDLARQFGLAGPKDSFGNAVAGFAVEVGLDPLTYVTLGGSALGKAGQAAKAAGLMDQAPLVAAKRAGVAAGSVGPREARITSTLGDLVRDNPKGLESAKTAAGGSIDDIADQPLGGLIGIGLPFMQPRVVLGTGATAQRVARGMDRAGAAVRFGKIPGTEFAPVNTVARLFDASLRGAETPIGQAVSKAQHRGLKAMSAEIDAEVVTLGQRLQDAGLGSRESGDFLRDVLEGVRPIEQLPEAARGVVEAMRNRLDTMPEEARRWGVQLESLSDLEAGYFPRHVPGEVAEVADRQALDARDWGRTGREDWLRDIPGGTTAIKRLVADQDVGRLIDQGASAGEVERALRSKYAGVIDDTYRAFEGGRWVERPGRFQALAGFIGGLSPELRRAGGFAQHPLEDYRQRLLAAGRAVEGAKALAMTLGQPGLLRRTWAASDQVVPVGDLVRKAGLRLDTGLGEEIARVAGVGVDAVPLLGVPKTIADDLEGAVRFMTEPKELTGLVRALDDFTNLWRASVTVPFPAFHFRNLVAGQAHNALLGLFSPSSLRDAHKMMRGGVVAGASEIPVVRREWAKTGGGPLDDRKATEILGRLLSSHGVIGSVGEPFSTVGRSRVDVSGMLPRVIDDALRPGRKSVSVREIGRKAVGRGEDVSWRPWEVRGVGGRTQSRFAPVAAGEDVAQYGEGLNRIGPFLHLLRRGVDPAEAARRVGAAQALYGRQDVTAFTADVVSRIFPFAKFTLGAAPEVVRQVLERPGGPMAQSLRAGGESSEAATAGLASEGIREGASVRQDHPILDRFLGPMPAGSDRYLSSFGLVQEDLLSFANPARELGGRLNPLLRGPLELATGTAFHSGGRVEALDPALGRFLGNSVGEERPVRLPSFVEHAIRVSPASRAVSTAAKVSEGTPQAILNALTGVRVSTVTPSTKGRVAGELIPGMPGAKRFKVRVANPSGPERQREAAVALLRALERESAG